MSSKFWPAAFAVIAAVLGLVAGIWLLRPPVHQISSGTQLPQPRAIADFMLSDHDGKAFSNPQLQGHWSLVFAGFLSCPDVCPTTLSFLHQLHSELARKNLDLKVVFLSVDPERDRPEQIKAYVQHFDPSFTGVTSVEPADDAGLVSFTRSLGLAYQKVPGANGEYTMDHSAALVLINPQGRIAAYFSPPHLLPPIALDLAVLMKP